MKDRDHLQEYLSGWYKFVDDYEKSKDTGNFEYPMTECYAKYPYLAPHQYGLVVIDYVENKILSNQSYTDLSYIFSCNVRLQMNGDIKYFWELLEDGSKSDSYCLREFFEAGRIVRLRTTDFHDHDKPKKIIALKDIKTSEQFLECLKNGSKENSNLGYCFFELDLNPFEVISFAESTNGFKIMNQAIADLGFEITDEDQKMFDDFIQNFN